MHGEWYSNAQHVAMLEPGGALRWDLAYSAVDWTRPIAGNGSRIPRLTFAGARLISTFFVYGPPGVTTPDPTSPGVLTIGDVTVTGDGEAYAEVVR